MAGDITIFILYNLISDFDWIPIIHILFYAPCFMSLQFAALHNELYEFVSYSAQSSQVSLLKNIILESKYLCIYEDSFGAKIVREDCAPKSSISIGINIFTNCC